MHSIGLRGKGRRLKAVYTHSRLTKENADGHSTPLLRVPAFEHYPMLVWMHLVVKRKRTTNQLIFVRVNAKQGVDDRVKQDEELWRPQR